MGRQRKKNIYYMVITKDPLASWVTPELQDAYKHAVYLSRLERMVKIREVVEKDIVEIRDGRVVNE